jgi:hypothetical protein
VHTSCGARASSSGDCTAGRPHTATTATAAARSRTTTTTAAARSRTTTTTAAARSRTTTTEVGRLQAVLCPLPLHCQRLSFLALLFLPLHCQRLSFLALLFLPLHCQRLSFLALLFLPLHCLHRRRLVRLLFLGQCSRCHRQDGRHFVTLFDSLGRGIGLTFVHITCLPEDDLTLHWRYQGDGRLGAGEKIRFTPFVIGTLGLGQRGRLRLAGRCSLTL